MAESPRFGGTRRAAIPAQGRKVQPSKAVSRFVSVLITCAPLSVALFTVIGCGKGKSALSPDPAAPSKGNAQPMSAFIPGTWGLDVVGIDPSLVSLFGRPKGGRGVRFTDVYTFEPSGLFKAVRLRDGLRLEGEWKPDGKQIRLLYKRANDKELTVWAEEMRAQTREDGGSGTDDLIWEELKAIRDKRDMIQLGADRKSLSFLAKVPGIDGTPIPTSAGYLIRLKASAKVD